MGIFDIFKRKKKNKYIQRKPQMSPECEERSKIVLVEKDARSMMPLSSGFPLQEVEEYREPLQDEYIELTSKLYRVWLEKYNKKKKYNYENEIIEELYDVGYFSTGYLHRLLKEDKEETEKLILFYTENEPTEENIDFYEEFMIRHKLYVRIEITDKIYNTLCKYISSCYDERPSGNVLAGELTVYSLSYDQYLRVKPTIEKEINIITDDTIDEEVKRRVMYEIRLTMKWYLTTKKSQFII